MKDAYLIQKYERCIELAKDVNLSFYVKGDTIRLENETKENLGVMESIDQLFCYLCGYYEGYKKGKLEK